MLNLMISPELAKAEMYERSKQIKALQLLNRAAAASPKQPSLKRITDKVKSLRTGMSTQTLEAASLAKQR